MSDTDAYSLTPEEEGYLDAQEDLCSRAYVDGRNQARRGDSKSPPSCLGDSERISWLEGYNDVINEETI